MACLDGKWNLYFHREETAKSFAKSFCCEQQLIDNGFEKIEGNVPGNFDLDMQAAGIIENLFFGENALNAQNMENYHLWYCREFEYSGDGKDTWFRFDGIDTVAYIFLNGTFIHKTDNMLISHEIEAIGIKHGKNSIMVYIEPVFIEARKTPYDTDVGAIQPYNADSVAIRKAAHMYGWDIMPRILSGGLWRSVYLTDKKSDRIDDLYLEIKEANAEKAVIFIYHHLTVSMASIKDYKLQISGSCGESTVFQEFPLWHTHGRCNISLVIEKPCLWWPKDMGEQNIYNLEVCLLYKGEKVDCKSYHLGIRTVRLERTISTDRYGNGKFQFFVNNVPFFVRGTNWVPLDAFHANDKNRLAQALALLEDIGCNMVRCWGGNVYEDTEFFAFCDQKGIAVWQDFAMACNSYPQDKLFAEKIKKEAEAVVQKLRCHPSIFLWSGDNECDIMNSWCNRKPDSNIITREVLPEVLKRLDNTRPYLPSSPFIDNSISQDFSRGTYDIPEDHLWGPRDYYKSGFYTGSSCHFASEIGYHGCPSPSSIEQFISQDCQWPIHWKKNMEWRVHASCMETSYNRASEFYSKRIPLMMNQVKVLFGDTVPDDLESFALASQISQAEADKFFIELFRTQKGRKTGILWWNLLDGWPQFSDAVVDYYFTKKLAYHFIKRSQQPLCLMMKEPINDALTLVGVNEYLTERKVSYQITDISLKKIIASGEAVIEANGRIEICRIPYMQDEKHFYIIEWEIYGKKFINHYLSGKSPFTFEQVVLWLRQVGLLEINGFGSYTGGGNNKK